MGVDAAAVGELLHNSPLNFDLTLEVKLQRWADWLVKTLQTIKLTSVFLGSVVLIDMTFCLYI